MKHAPVRILLAALVVGLLAVGCSDSDDDKKDEETTTTVASSDSTTDTGSETGSGETPTVDEVSQGLQDGLGLDAAKADCVAEKLVDELSTEVLTAMANADPDALPADQLEASQAAAAEAAASC